jgi:hypothetical protein
MRQIALAVIDIALIGGLLWSLWFVIHRSRQRARRIAEQLDEPIILTKDRLLIRINRREAIASTSPMLVLTAMGLEAIAIGKVATGFILLAVFTPLLLFGGREVLQRRPVLVLDGNGMTVLGWKGMTLSPTEMYISWTSIREAWVKERTSFGSTRHELMCELVPPERVEVPLERRSMPWNDLVRAIEDRLGRRVMVIKH